MKYECFEVKIEDSIAHIELSRPEKRNSMNPAFWRELPQIIEDIDENVRARVIVISSKLVKEVEKMNNGGGGDANSQRNCI